MWEPQPLLGNLSTIQDAPRLQPVAYQGQNQILIPGILFCWLTHAWLHYYQVSVGTPTTVQYINNRARLQTPPKPYPVKEFLSSSCLSNCGILPADSCLTLSHFSSFVPSVSGGPHVEVLISEGCGFLRPSFHSPTSIFHSSTSHLNPSNESSSQLSCQAQALLFC